MKNNKKIILVLVTLAVTIFSFLGLMSRTVDYSTAYGEEPSLPTIDYVLKAKEYMEMLESEMPDRNYSTIDKKPERIKELFDDVYYDINETTTDSNIYGASDASKYRTFEIKNKNYNENKQNILFFASVDNFYGAKMNGMNYLEKATGAYGSGVGFATILLMSEMAKNKTFEYNIVFVLTSGNDTASVFGSFPTTHGTLSYINKVTNIGKTALVVDVTRPLGGEFNYIYTGETDKVLYNKVFLYMNANGSTVKQLPKNKKVYVDTSTDSAFGIRHAGMTNVSLPYMERNIQTLSLLSFNWDDPYANIEFSNKQNLYSSDEDTLAKLLERAPNLYSDMATLSTTLLGMLDNSDIKTAIKTAGEESEFVPLARFNTFSIIAYVIFGIAVVLTILLSVYFKKHNNTNTGRPSEVFGGDQKQTPAVEENKEDVFKGF